MGPFQYEQGDLIRAAQRGDINVVAHCCNCFNIMGAGVAKDIAEAFPDAELADKQTVKGATSKLGTYSRSNMNYPAIYNLYGQYYYGRYEGKAPVNYEAIRKSLDGMVRDIHRRIRQGDFKNSKIRVGMPKIGSGLAGGDWRTIEEIIKNVCKDLNVTIYYL